MGLWRSWDQQCVWTWKKRTIRFYCRRISFMFADFFQGPLGYSPKVCSAWQWYHATNVCSRSILPWNHLTLSNSGRTRGCKLEEGRLMLDVRRKFFTQWIVRLFSVCRRKRGQGDLTGAFQYLKGAYKQEKDWLFITQADRDRKRGNGFNWQRGDLG